MTASCAHSRDLIRARRELHSETYPKWAHASQKWSTVRVRGNVNVVLLETQLTYPRNWTVEWKNFIIIESHFPQFLRNKGNLWRRLMKKIGLLLLKYFFLTFGFSPLYEVWSLTFFITPELLLQDCKCILFKVRKTHLYLPLFSGEFKPVFFLPLRNIFLNSTLGVALS